MDLVSLNRLSIEGSGHHGVRGDSGSRPNSLVSVDGGQASIHEQGRVVGGIMDTLQQIAQALQRAAKPAQVAPQRIAIERMTRYRPIDFLGKKDDEPSMAENWLERTENASTNALHTRGKFRVCDLTTSR